MLADSPPARYIHNASGRVAPLPGSALVLALRGGSLFQITFILFDLCLQAINQKTWRQAEDSSDHKPEWILFQIKGSCQFKPFPAQIRQHHR